MYVGVGVNVGGIVGQGNEGQGGLTSVSGIPGEPTTVPGRPG